MSEELTIQGQLSDTTTVDLFRSMVKSGETGIVALELPEGTDTIYFKGGKIVFAATTDPDFGLAEVLLSSGELTLSQYNDAVERSASGKRVGAVLCELGYLSPDELTRAVDRQVSEIVRRTITLRTGQYTIRFTSEFPHEIISLTLGTERLILDGASDVRQWSLMMRGLQRPDRRIAQASNADARLFHIDLTEEEMHVYSLLGSPLTLEALCQRSYLSDFATCRSAWALLGANLLDDSDAAPADQQLTEAESELEFEAFVERFNGAYQQLFATVFQEIGDSAYDFLDRVTAHLPAELVPFLGGVSLANEGRLDFDELMNNVISSGIAEREATVRKILDQLLYGWLVEIRAEFGDKLNQPVAHIAVELRK